MPSQPESSLGEAVYEPRHFWRLGPVSPHQDVRFIRSCSAPLAPALIDRLEQRFGAPVLEAYGMTEAIYRFRAWTLLFETGDRIAHRRRREPPTFRRVRGVRPTLWPAIAWSSALDRSRFRRGSLLAIFSFPFGVPETGPISVTSQSSSCPRKSDHRLPRVELSRNDPGNRCCRPLAFPCCPSTAGRVYF
jgi:acyl-CoA synthetase (AMP-forming)/AMP-acid ligase II